MGGGGSGVSVRGPVGGIGKQRTHDGLVVEVDGAADLVVQRRCWRAEVDAPHGQLAAGRDVRRTSRRDVHERELQAVVGVVLHLLRHGLGRVGHGVVGVELPVVRLWWVVGTRESIAWQSVDAGGEAKDPAALALRRVAEE